MVRGAPFWKHWLGQPLASADTVGRVHALLENEGLRSGLQHLYRRLKRNKALRSVGGWEVAVLDGHENHASYRRHCAGCLQRTIHTEGREQIQFYHRQVILMLRSEKFHFLLDVEAQLPGEDLAAALRLLQRVLQTYPRAFQLLVADGLYARAPFLNFLITCGQAGPVGAERRASRSLSRRHGLVASDDTPERSVPIAGLSVVGCVGSDLLAASACSTTRGALAGNLRGAPSGQPLGIRGTRGMDVGDDLIHHPSLHRAGRESGARAMGYRKLWLQ
jgi:hypothetical protein